MDKKRLLLILALSLFITVVWHNWIAPSLPHAATPVATQQAVASGAAAQQGVGATHAASHPTAAQDGLMAHASHWVSVQTDTLNVKIDPQGGSIVSVALRAYPQSLKNKQPVFLLDPHARAFFVSEQGVLSGGSLMPVINYKVAQSRYALKDGQSRVEVVLTGVGQGGLKVQKTYRFTRGSYVVGMHYSLQNTAKQAWSGNVYTQLTRQNQAKAHAFAAHSYTGAAFSTTAVPYKQWSYKKLASEPYHEVTQGGWVAFQEKYFLAAIIPNPDQSNALYSTLEHQGVAQQGQGVRYSVGVASPVLTLEPGAKADNTTRFYFGPEEEALLKGVAPHLDKTIDYGMFWWMAEPIFWLLSFIHHFVGNWGWAIVLVTLLIKLILHPLTAVSFRSMARMRTLAPKIALLKQQHGDDKMKLNQATMQLYKDENINPAAGCLPMLLQIPVFIALYSVLMVSVELRQAPFIFWIHDLAVYDPYYVLPVLMGLSMFVQQRMTPQPADASQAKMMMLMPVVFTFFFLHFPSGLVVYWITNNVSTIVQQWWVTRQVTAFEGRAKPPKKGHK